LSTADQGVISRSAINNIRPQTRYHRIVPRASIKAVVAIRAASRLACRVQAGDRLAAEAERRKVAIGLQATHAVVDHRRDDDDENKESFAALSSVCFFSRKYDDWYADTGASDHMTSLKSIFSSYTEFENPITVGGIGGVKVKALGAGPVPLLSYVNGETKHGTLQNVLYVPDLNT
jgi:hypothetical protein